MTAAGIPYSEIRWLSPLQFKMFTRASILQGLERFRDGVRQARSINLETDEDLVRETQGMERYVNTHGPITRKGLLQARIEARYGVTDQSGVLHPREGAEPTDAEWAEMGIEVQR